MTVNLIITTTLMSRYHGCLKNDVFQILNLKYINLLMFLYSFMKINNIING